MVWVPVDSGNQATSQVTWVSLPVPSGSIGNHGEEASVHPHLQQAQQGVEEDVPR